ncbi:MAG: hypothetical protein SGARI_007457, partial [Bacillariaceae sp.]
AVPLDGWIRSVEFPDLAKTNVQVDRHHLVHRRGEEIVQSESRYSKHCRYILRRSFQSVKVQERAVRNILVGDQVIVNSETNVHLRSRYNLVHLARLSAPEPKEYTQKTPLLVPDEKKRPEYFKWLECRPPRGIREQDIRTDGIEGDRYHNPNLVKGSLLYGDTTDD